MCPLNISVGPPPVPARVASTFARPSSTCCHCTASPSSWHWPAIHAAIASSEPVKLGIETAASASATRRSRSITGPVLPCPAALPAARVRGSSRARLPATPGSRRRGRRPARGRPPAARRPPGSTNNPRGRRGSTRRPCRRRPDSSSRSRVHPPLEHRPRHVHRTGDDAVASALVVRAQVDDHTAPAARAPLRFPRLVAADPLAGVREEVLSRGNEAAPSRRRAGSGRAARRPTARA